MVRTKFAPNGLYTQAVRSTALFGQSSDDPPLAGELGPAVGAGRAGRIVLAVGSVEHPVEHVVGRQMQERRADSGRRLGDVAGALAIDRHGEVFLALGLVDRRIGGRVDHDVGPRRGDSGQDALPVFERDRRPAERDDLDPRPGALDQGGRDLSFGPGDGDAHQGNSSAASLRRGQRLSFSDSKGPPGGSRQSIPMSGSSQATPRSLAGA